MSQFTKEDGEKLVEATRALSAHAELDIAEQEVGPVQRTQEEALAHMFDKLERMSNLVADWLPIYVKFMKANKPKEWVESNQIAMAYMDTLQKIGPALSVLVNLALNTEVTKEQ